MGGSCDWVCIHEDGTAICDSCPIGNASSHPASCATYVANKLGYSKECIDDINELDGAYLKVANRLLGDMEAGKILLGEENE